MILNRQQIIDADDFKHEDVPVPEWGGDVRVATISANERDAFEKSITVERENGKVETLRETIRARLCAATIVDEDDNKLFTQDDIDVLGAKSAKAVDRVFEVAKRLNGIGEADVKELEGNSEAAPSG